MLEEPVSDDEPKPAEMDSRKKKKRTQSTG
jgi:hypothetical protein